MGALPEAMRENIRNLYDIPDVRHASEKFVAIVGTTEVKVQIGTSTKTVIFLISKKLPSTAILDCAFCDVHVETVHTRRNIVDVDDAFEVPIIC